MVSGSRLYLLPAGALILAAWLATAGGVGRGKCLHYLLEEDSRAHTA